MSIHQFVRFSILKSMIGVVCAFSILGTTFISQHTVQVVHAEPVGTSSTSLHRKGSTPGFADPVVGNQIPSIPQNCDGDTEVVPAFRNFCYPKVWAGNGGSDAYYGTSPLREWIADDDSEYRHWDFVTPEYDESYNPGWNGFKEDDTQGFQNVYIDGQAFRSRWAKDRIIFMFHIKGRVPTDADKNDVKTHRYFLDLATSQGLEPIQGVEANKSESSVIKVLGKRPTIEGSNSSYVSSTNDLYNSLNIEPMKEASGGDILENGKWVKGDQPARIELTNIKPGADVYVLVHAKIHSQPTDVNDTNTDRGVDRYGMKARLTVTGNAGTLNSFDKINFSYPNSKYFYRKYEWSATYPNAITGGSWQGNLDIARKSNKSVLAEVSISKEKQPVEPPMSTPTRAYPYLDETQDELFKKFDKSTANEVDRYQRQDTTKNNKRLTGEFTTDANHQLLADRNLIMPQEYENEHDIATANRERPITDLIQTSEGNQVINVKGDKTVKPALDEDEITIPNTREYTDSFLTMNVDTLSTKSDGQVDTSSQQYRNAQQGIFDVNMRVQGKDHKNDRYGNDYIFVVDRSGSMGAQADKAPKGVTKWDLLTKTLKSSIEQLTKDNDSTNRNDDSDPNAAKNNRIGIISFADTAWMWNGGTYHLKSDIPLSPNGEEAKAYVDTMIPGGATNYIGALKLLKDTLDLLPKQTEHNRRRTHVLFITDGEPTSSYKIERMFYDTDTGKPYPESTFETYGDFVIGKTMQKSLQSKSRFKLINGARPSFMALLDSFGQLGEYKFDNGKDPIICRLAADCPAKNLELYTQQGRYTTIVTNIFPLRYKNQETGEYYTNPPIPWCDIDRVIVQFEMRNCVSRADNRYLPILDPHKYFQTSVEFSGGRWVKWFGYDWPKPYESAANQLKDEHIENILDMLHLDVNEGDSSAVHNYAFKYHRTITPEIQKRMITNHGQPTKLEIAKLRAEYPDVQFFAEAIVDADSYNGAPDPITGYTYADAINNMENLLLNGIAGGDAKHYARVNGENFDELFFKANYPDTFVRRVNGASISWKVGDKVKLAVPSVLAVENVAETLPSANTVRSRRALQDPITLQEGKDYTLDTSTYIGTESRADWKKNLDVVYDPNTHTVSIGKKKNFDLGKYEWLNLKFKIQADRRKPAVRDGEYVLVAGNLPDDNEIHQNGGAVLHTHGPADGFGNPPGEYIDRYFPVPSVRVKPRFADAIVEKRDTENLETAITGNALETMKLAITLEDGSRENLPTISYAPKGTEKAEQATGFSLSNMQVGVVYKLAEIAAPKGYGITKNPNTLVRIMPTDSIAEDPSLPVPSGTSKDPAENGKSCDLNGYYSCSRTPLRLQWKLANETTWTDAVDFAGDVAHVHDGGVVDNNVSLLKFVLADPKSKNYTIYLKKIDAQVGFEIKDPAVRFTLVKAGDGTCARLSRTCFPVASSDPAPLRESADGAGGKSYEVWTSMPKYDDGTPDIRREVSADSAYVSGSVVEEYKDVPLAADGTYFRDLEPGRYYLLERSAADGYYQPLQAFGPVVLDSSAVPAGATVTVIAMNQPKNGMLPKAGSTGVIVPMLLGGLLILFGMVMCSSRVRQRLGM